MPNESIPGNIVPVFSISESNGFCIFLSDVILGEPLLFVCFFGGVFALGDDF